ncbi:lipocalin family protein [Myroides odoratus]|uniref:lipocalin family protein n=1 Tax=Myroides odoratus TaxID=256 RepID=UPI00333E9246
MKKIKELIRVCLVIGTMISLGSCSMDSNSRNEEGMEQKEINAAAITKKWIVTHFAFTTACNKADKLKYQLSSIHLDLDQDSYTAIDQYSLKEDKGSWKLDGNTITLSSDTGFVYLKMKINKLSKREMEAEVIEHRDIVGVELITAP